MPDQKRIRFLRPSPFISSRVNTFQANLYLIQQYAYGQPCSNGYVLCSGNWIPQGQLIPKLGEHPRHVCMHAQNSWWQEMEEEGLYYHDPLGGCFVSVCVCLSLSPSPSLSLTIGECTCPSQQKIIKIHLNYRKKKLTESLSSMSLQSMWKDKAHTR